MPAFEAPLRPADTDPESYRVQMELLRQASPAERGALAVALSNLTLQLAWKAIRDSHPSAPPDEQAVLYVRHLYGQDLAEAVRRRLASRRDTP